MRHAFEPVLAEVDRLEPAAVDRGGRGEDLAAAGGRAHARSVMHRHTDVAVADDLCAAAVQAHPYPHRGALRPRLVDQRELGGDCGSGGGRAVVEHGEELVATAVDDPPAVVPDGRADQLAVPLQDGCVRGAEPLQQAGRAFDIGEQEGDVGRVFRHRG